VTARVVAEAIELARAGGTFVPVSGFLALREVICAAVESKPLMPSFLTTRQGAVAEALRKGKANKIIAYELNMCESTVKVHVRNIMKKVQATNRTQVATNSARWEFSPQTRRTRIVPSSPRARRSASAD